MKNPSGVKRLLSLVYTRFLLSKVICCWKNGSSIERDCETNTQRKKWICRLGAIWIAVYCKKKKYKKIKMMTIEFTDTRGIFFAHTTLIAIMFEVMTWPFNGLKRNQYHDFIQHWQGPWRISLCVILSFIFLQLNENFPERSEKGITLPVSLSLAQILYKILFYIEFRVHH